MQKFQVYLKKIILAHVRSNLYETLQQHDVSWEKSIQFYDINDFETNQNETNAQCQKIYRNEIF